MATMQEPTNYAEAVHLFTPRFVATFAEVMDKNAPAPVATATRRDDGVWELQFRVIRGDGRTVTGNVPFNPAGPAIVSPDRQRPHQWGMRRLGHGVWLLSPSIVQEGQLHAFIVVYDIPEPAPWTR